MDASSSPTKSNLKDVYGLLIEIEKSGVENAVNHKNTVIKYTKLPDYDINSEEQWVKKRSDVHVRTRRVATLEETPVYTARSLKADLLSPHRLRNTNVGKRKIVIIEEEEENDLHPKFTREIRKANNQWKAMNKSVETEHKNDKQFSQRTTSRLTTTPKYSKENKMGGKNNVYSKKDSSAHKTNSRSKFTNQCQETTKSSKNEKETVRSRNNKSPSKIVLLTPVSKTITPRENDKDTLKKKEGMKENVKNVNSYKKPTSERSNIRSNQPPKRNVLLKGIKQHKPVTIIHIPLNSQFSKNDVPLDGSYLESVADDASHKPPTCPILDEIKNNLESCTEVNHSFVSKDAATETNVQIITKDKITQINEETIACDRENNASAHTDLTTAFDSLAVPNVTLMKSDSKDLVKFHSKSLPNLQVPLLNVTSLSKTGHSDTAFHNNGSYIISHATVTCTTRQKINFHVVSNNNSETSNPSSPMPYPMNAVSIFKKELKNHDEKSNVACADCSNELLPLNGSYVANRHKLVKPSDIISTIRVNTGLLHSDFILCEQFQRELNFIDSFFESLQYLENNFLSEKRVKSFLKGTGVGAGLSEYGSFLSNLEQAADVGESEAVASNSLCLLNLLIRDEQRRAENLLFVLKMREDALKDFTKSQILWLEKKKKQENTDISTLKKKQRGALLKLHHECGEMHRMRKALLTQSEKRKVALMKTKKNIELKLRGSVDVDQIILGKKKLKRSISDRGHVAPLKCFELSSSAREDTPTRPDSEEILAAASPSVPTLVADARAPDSVSSAEKSIQTGDSILHPGCALQPPEPCAEHFVCVDGGYLNILFRSVAQPQIFNGGKQYEVNEEALRNILDSANSRHSFSEAELLERFVNQIKNPEAESSSPSTARSLVEEFDQYYRGFTADDSSPAESFHDACAPSTLDEKLQVDVHSYGRDVLSAAGFLCDSSATLVDAAAVSLHRPCVCQADQYREPAFGSATSTSSTSSASAASLPPDPAHWATTRATVTEAADYISDGDPGQDATLLSAAASPVHCEAEELRKQQLAIEREIRALEEQQCRLLAVRAIPDKPPPPYAPPAAAAAAGSGAGARRQRAFVAGEAADELVRRYIGEPHAHHAEPADAFDAFVKDFCAEALEREPPEPPWEPWELPEPREPRDARRLLRATSRHLAHALSAPAPPPAKCGLRRAERAERGTEHVDGVVVAAWRRGDARWAATRPDELAVKNQLFQSIFQRVLTETVDEYKKTVVCDRV